MYITPLDAFDVLGIEDEGFLVKFDTGILLPVAQYEELDTEAKRFVVDPTAYADNDHAALIDWILQWVNQANRQSIRNLAFDSRALVTRDHLLARTVIAVGSLPAERSIEVGRPVTTGFSFICSNGWLTKTRNLANTFGTVTDIAPYWRQSPA